MIDFLKYRLVYFLLSLLVIGTGLYYLLNYGLVYSLDFVGGGLLEFSANQEQTVAAKALINKKYPSLNFQVTSKGFVVKSTSLSKIEADKINKELVQKTKAHKERYELVGPSISQGNVQKIIVAASLALLGILLYVAFTFHDWRYGVAAIIALLHDTLVLVGSWAVLGYFLKVEFDVLFVTSLLTTMSFSVHDTIVIFEQIQEEETTNNFPTMRERINWALNLTMMRSLNNSLTVVIMLSSLIILGGESTRWFAASLLIGTITGTYSSPFVATPLYYLLSSKED